MAAPEQSFDQADFRAREIWQGRDKARFN
jgi:hypothetical protein